MEVLGLVAVAVLAWRRYRKKKKAAVVPAPSRTGFAGNDETPQHRGMTRFYDEDELPQPDVSALRRAELALMMGPADSRETLLEEARTAPPPRSPQPLQPADGKYKDNALAGAGCSMEWRE